jgi:hypothetical protein
MMRFVAAFIAPDTGHKPIGALPGIISHAENVGAMRESF